MSDLPHRHECLKRIYRGLESLIDDLGSATAAELIAVSPDTIRRRLRGSQPWFFEEVFELARHEIERGQGRDVAEAITTGFVAKDAEPGKPLLLPSNLREMLRQVGSLTTDIADTLDDGRIDSREAVSLLDRLGNLEMLIDNLQRDLRALIERG